MNRAKKNKILYIRIINKNNRSFNIRTMADPQGKNRLQEFKYKGKDQDVSKTKV